MVGGGGGDGYVGDRGMVGCVAMSEARFFFSLERFPLWFGGSSEGRAE